MKSAALSIVILTAVIIFLLVFTFIWMGSSGLDYERVAMTGDQQNVTSTQPQPHTESQPETAAVSQSHEDDSPRENTVVWINIPGFRNDYVEKSSAEFMQEMISSGAATNKLRPNFPPLTYPGHITMATGASPKSHGILSSSFRVGDQIITNPTDPSLLKVEPIWQTAVRQDRLSLVHDWPLSQNQTGRNKATYFLNDFDKETNDQQRLDRLWEAWADHQGEKKLRLLMCRLDDTLKAGQLNGPQAEETHEAVRQTDELISNFIAKAKAAWPNLRSGSDGNLVVMITTDHGLTDLDQYINLPHLLGEDLMANLDPAFDNSICHLYFKDLPESEAEANLRKDQIDSELKKRIYFRTYKQEEFPSDWNYNSADDRIGDRVLVLKSGLCFSDIKNDDPIYEPSAGPGFYGGYGYPVTDSFRMSGQVILWGYPNQVASSDFGEIDHTVFHTTVCRLLDIKPSSKAQRRPLKGLR